jgi:hypothetical protein
MFKKFIFSVTAFSCLAIPWTLDAAPLTGIKIPGISTNYITDVDASNNRVFFGRNFIVESQESLKITAFVFKLDGSSFVKEGAF